MTPFLPPTVEVRFERADQNTIIWTHGDRCCCAGWTWKRETHRKHTVTSDMLGGTAERLTHENSGAISGCIPRLRGGIKALPPFALLVSLHPSRSLPTYEIYSKLGYVLPFVLPQKRTRSLKFYHQNLWQMFGCLFVVFAFCTSRCRVQRCMRHSIGQKCSKHSRKSPMSSSELNLHRSKVYLAVPHQSPK